MSWIEKIVIWQYLAPIFLTTAIVFYAEKKMKTHPCRDEEELVGRVTTAFCAIIVFSFVQAIIRSQ